MEKARYDRKKKRIWEEENNKLCSPFEFLKLLNS
jgi:hypothetical protein